MAKSMAVGGDCTIMDISTTQTDGIDLEENRTKGEDSAQPAKIDPTTKVVLSRRIQSLKEGRTKLLLPDEWKQRDRLLREKLKNL
jgi:hypothetical protein